jgi:DNA-directed RNA polymerase subunit RPC12/RpoP
MMDEARQGRYVCLSCNEEFPGIRLAPSGMGDYSCPTCGSLRVERLRSRFERLHTFLVRYNLN